MSLTAATAGGTSPADSISAAKLKGHIYFLTSDFLERRFPGSRGFRIAAEYAVSQFKAAGLLPPTGPNGRKSYDQSMPLAKRTVTEAAKVSLRVPGGEKIFGAGNLTLYTSEGLPEDGRFRPVVFAGFGIKEPAAGWDDFKGLDIAGKVVLLMMGAPARDGKPVLPPELHKIYTPLNSINRKLMAAREAAAVFFLFDETLAEAFASLPAVPESPQFVLDDEEEGAFVIPPLGFLSAGLSQAIFGDPGVSDPEAVGEGRVPKGERKDVALGIPAVHFYTGRIPDTHQPTDTPDKLDYEKAAKLARLVYEITMELANRERL